MAGMCAALLNGGSRCFSCPGREDDDMFANRLPFTSRSRPLVPKDQRECRRLHHSSAQRFSLTVISRPALAREPSISAFQPQYSLNRSLA